MSNLHNRVIKLEKDDRKRETVIVVDWTCDGRPLHCNGKDITQADLETLERDKSKEVLVLKIVRDES